MPSAESPCKRPRTSANRDKDTVILLVGMRAAGKTTMGRETANVLGFDFVDLDEHITAQNGGKLPPQIVEERGWPGFRDTERNSLRAATSGQLSKGKPLVVACGGGVVETEESMQLLRSHWPVVFIERDIESIADALASAMGSHRAKLGEDPRDTYKRRFPKYLECSDFRIWMFRRPNEMCVVLAFIVRHILAAKPVYVGPDTFFLSLTLPKYTDVGRNDLKAALAGADVLELRVDLLACLEHSSVAEQVAALRCLVGGVPLLFTVRSKHEGGRFEGTVEEYAALLRLGRELGCELLDVESTMCNREGGAAVVAELQQKGYSRVVGSFHDFHNMPSEDELRQKFLECDLNGAADVLKVVVKARSRADCLAVQQIGSAVTPSGKVFIGLCLGDMGKLSRVLNQALTPCTHSSLASAAPGQLAVSDVMICRATLSIKGSHFQYPVLAPWGAQILDVAPRLHQQAFADLGLRHVCQASPVFSSGELEHALTLHSVGGALIGGRLREQWPGSVQPDKDAAAIGSVDMIVRRKSGMMQGLNVESLALRSHMEEAVSVAADCVGVVAGSGPSAKSALRALQRLGVCQRWCSSEPQQPGVEEDALGRHLFLPNTFADALAQLSRVDILVLADGHTVAEASQQLEATIARCKPLVVEATCTAAAAALTAIAAEKGCKVVNRSTLILERASICSREWTGQTAPRERVVAALQALNGTLNK